MSDGNWREFTRIGPTAECLQLLPRTQMQWAGALGCPRNIHAKCSRVNVTPPNAMPRQRLSAIAHHVTRSIPPLQVGRQGKKHRHGKSIVRGPLCDQNSSLLRWCLFKGGECARQRQHAARGTESVRTAIKKEKAASIQKAIDHI